MFNDNLNTTVSEPSKPELPPRTVPDSALRFRFKASFDAGSAIHYKHLQINPADFKVVMKVRNSPTRLSYGFLLTISIVEHTKIHTLIQTYLRNTYRQTCIHIQTCMHTYINQVAIPDLNLNDTERRIFVRMVGPRYQQGSHEVKLVSDRFPNRLENRKYLIFLLESLLLETRRLCAEKDTLSLPRPPKDDNEEVEGIPRIL